MKKPAFTAIRSSAQAGFTLIELIVVIVILGILAATALPRFANLGGDARVASLSAARGALQSTVSMVHGQALLNPAGPIVNENISMALVNGYPAATANLAAGAGLNVADYAITASAAGQNAGPNAPAIPANSLLIIPLSVSTTTSGLTCYLMYTESTAANVPPVILQVATENGCR